ncbi:MAG: thymidine phosphorylase, partial [Firmicutes bacterium]|nr:thymidine phosphorylase [Bacillota bacterium]
MTMNMVDIIRKKRDGYVLSREEFAVWVQGAVKGEVPEYQSSAMLIACVQRGLKEDETFDLTMEILHTGDVFDWRDLE